MQLTEGQTSLGGNSSCILKGVRGIDAHTDHSSVIRSAAWARRDPWDFSRPSQQSSS